MLNLQLRHQGLQEGLNMRLYGKIKQSTMHTPPRYMAEVNRRASILSDSVFTAETDWFDSPYQARLYVELMMRPELYIEWDAMLYNTLNDVVGRIAKATANETVITLIK